LPVEERKYSLLYSVQAGSGAHPVSYPIDTGGADSPRVEQGHEADYSSPSNAEIKNGGAIPPFPTHTFMALCLIKHRDNFTLTFTIKSSRHNYI
jgi:hypothetical protein